MRIAIVIPAYNEAAALPKVLGDLPRGLAQRIVVSDNGSSDGTPDVALACGAEVVRETRRGYGWACWAGVNAVLHDCDVIAMLDAGGKEDATELPLLLQPILRRPGRFCAGVAGALRGSGCTDAVAAVWQLADNADHGAAVWLARWRTRHRPRALPRHSRSPSCKR